MSSAEKQAVSKYDKWSGNDWCLYQAPAHLAAGSRGTWDAALSQLSGCCSPRTDWNTVFCCPLKRRMQQKQTRSMTLSVPDVAT